MIPASRQYRSRRAASSVGSLVDTVRMCSASHPFCPLHRRRSSPDVAAAIVAAVHAGADHLTSSTVDLPPHKFLVTFATLHCRLYRLSVAFATVFPVFPRFPYDPPLAAVCGGERGNPVAGVVPLSPCAAAVRAGGLCVPPLLSALCSEREVYLLWRPPPVIWWGLGSMVGPLIWAPPCLRPGAGTVTRPPAACVPGCAPWRLRE